MSCNRFRLVLRDLLYQLTKIPCVKQLGIQKRVANSPFSGSTTSRHCGESRIPEHASVDRPMPPNYPLRYLSYHQMEASRPSMRVHLGGDMHGLGLIPPPDERGTTSCPRLLAPPQSRPAPWPARSASRRRSRARLETHHDPLTLAGSKRRSI